MIRIIFLVSNFVFLHFSCAFAGIIYVNILASGSTDGSSWSNAFTNLQDALLVSTAGDDIWVAQGTYLPTNTMNREISFEIKDGVSLYGGFSGGEIALSQREWLLHETILSGDIGESDFYDDNSFNVIFAQNFNFIRLDGFTITKGKAFFQNVFEPANSPKKNGAGCYFIGSGNGNNANPALYNCKFKLNFAAFNGGAIFIEAINGGSSIPIFSNCSFENNASNGGGAIYFNGGGQSGSKTQLTNCTFFMNGSNFYGGAVNIQNIHGTSDWVIKNCEFNRSDGILGGGIYYNDSNPDNKLIIDSCLFFKNRGISEGGALWCFWFDNKLSQIITNTVFKENHSGYYDSVNPEESFGTGGAILLQYFIFDSLVTVDFNNCIFEKNSSVTGGAITFVGCNTNFINTVFDSNGAFEDGGAMHMTDDGLGIRSRFINCALANNYAYLSGGAFRSVKNSNAGIKPIVEFSNSILYGNSALEGDIGYVSNTDVNYFNSWVDKEYCDSLATGFPFPFNNYTINCDQNVIFNQLPLFADTAAHDFTLLPCSPAIDAGDSAIVDSLGITTDIAGN
ncbi:MAG: hypothetical protein EPO28_16935, partial [Saprospiraceae bacterium]